jgi:hypothetical protein
MKRSPAVQEMLPTDNPEVRSYVKGMLGVMLLGIVLMALTAVWAWNTYGVHLKEAAPLPSGTPPLSTVPVTSR